MAIEISARKREMQGTGPARRMRRSRRAGPVPCDSRLRATISIAMALPLARNYSMNSELTDSSV